MNNFAWNQIKIKFIFSWNRHTRPRWGTDEFRVKLTFSQLNKSWNWFHEIFHVFFTRWVCFLQRSIQMVYREISLLANHSKRGNCRILLSQGNDCKNVGMCNLLDFDRRMKINVSFQCIECDDIFFSWNHTPKVKEQLTVKWHLLKISPYHLIYLYFISYT